MTAGNGRVRDNSNEAHDRVQAMSQRVISRSRRSRSMHMASVGSTNSFVRVDQYIDHSCVGVGAGSRVFDTNPHVPVAPGSAIWILRHAQQRRLAKSTFCILGQQSLQWALQVGSSSSWIDVSTTNNIVRMRYRFWLDAYITTIGSCYLFRLYHLGMNDLQ